MLEFSSVLSCFIIKLQMVLFVERELEGAAQWNPSAALVVSDKAVTIPKEIRKPNIVPCCYNQEHVLHSDLH